MKQHIKRIAWQILAAIFLIVGIAGLFLPLLQGALFIVIGLFILSMTSESARAFIHRARDKFPKWKHHFIAWEEKMEKRVGHWFR